MNSIKSKVLLSLIAALSIAANAASANDKTLIQSWECRLAFGDFDVEYSIKLNSDDTYFSNMVIMTSSTTEEGTWRSENGTLFLAPSKTIQRGKPLESRTEYQRQIVELSASKLILKHEDAFGDPAETVCKIA